MFTILPDRYITKIAGTVLVSAICSVLPLCLVTREFSKFLSERINVPKSEQVIPDVADALIKSGEATVKVLDTDSLWFGVTYADDRAGVVEKFAELHKAGIYPDKLF